jgi:hypothetical protein
VRSIYSLLGERDAELPFLADRVVRLGSDHSIAGNRLRPHDGALQIRPDDEWSERMDPRSRRLATLPAAPLMPRYGYPVLRARSGR